MIRITITMKDDGSVEVNGPLKEKVLCYGMLETAKDIVRSYKHSEIVVPDITQIPRKAQ